MCCKYASGAIHIFFLCRFKINHDGDKKHAFILGPAS
jgi:hypothetical protein